MREVKFRAMLSDKYYAHPRMVPWGDLLESFDALHIFDEDCMTLMQYTGLHDKNGREVYEGDIVKNEYGDVDVVQYGTQDHEEDYGDRFVYQGWNIQIGSGYPDAVMIEYTVIGNIYDNPELMEVAEHER